MKRQVILAALAFFLVQTVYCRGDLGVINDKRFVFGLDLGIAKVEHLGSAIKFPLGFSTFNYLPEQNASYPLRYGVLLGRKFKLNALNTMMIGLSYHQLSTQHVKGILEQGISPPFYSANYQYSVQLSQLLAEVKLQHAWQQSFFPYLLMGLGSGFNKANYFSTTVPEYLTLTPTFTKHSKASFSYALGLGIDTLLSANVTVGLGYLFSDLGQVGLGNGSIRNRSLPNFINQTQLNIHTILIQLNWYF